MVAASEVTGVTAGVPFIAVPPARETSGSTPTVVAWHLLDSPRTEAAFAAALPLEGLDAWRVYLGLPMCGSRLPPGGLDELMRLGEEDAVLNLHGPISRQAMAEFGEAFAQLRRQLGLGAGPVGVIGGSLGAAVAELVLAESDIQISAAVLVNPLLQLRPVIEVMERRFGVTYTWSDQSLEVARRLDFVARVEEVTQRQDQPAVLLVVGEEDDPSFHQSAAKLRDALLDRYTDPHRVQLVVVPGLGHALATEPGMEPAPQLPEAAVVDRYAVEWLKRYLW